MNEEAKIRVCQEVVRIMRMYDEQNRRGYVDSPGGLEHMGDVWRLLGRWRDALLADNT